MDVSQLRGDAKGLVLFFMRTAGCAVCVRHVRALARLDLAGRGVAAAVVVPGGEAEAARVRRIAGGLPVVASPGAAEHRAAGLDRTLLLQHSGTVLIDARGEERYRLVAALPTGSFDAAALTAAIDRL